MSRRFRLIYFFFAVAIFFVIAPLLVYYAAGWRFNIAAKKFQKVGGLTIATEPRGATVQLDKKFLTKKTPLTIDNLLPRDYTVNLQKEGYYPWAREVTVSSGESLRLDPLYLLKQPATEMKPFLDGVTLAVPSPTGNAMAVAKSQQLIIVDIAAPKIKYDKKQRADITRLAWSASASKLALVLASGVHVIIDPTAPDAELNLNELFTIPIASLQWSSTDDSVLYAKTATAFYRLNIFQRTKSLITAAPEIAYVNGDLYFQELASGLKIVTADGEIKKYIPLAADYRLEYAQLGSSVIGIIDAAHQQLTVYQVKNNTYAVFPEAVAGLLYRQATEQVLLFNNFELWLWDMVTDERHLLTRTSDTIVSAAWLKKEQYVMYAQEKSGLTIIETAGPERNIYTIPLVPVSQLQSNSTGESVAVLSNNSLYSFSF